MLFCSWVIILMGALICQIKSKASQLNLCCQFPHHIGCPSLSLLDLIRWQESLSRFKHIFGLNTQARYRDIQLYYLSGNHDIGYAILHSRNPQVKICTSIMMVVGLCVCLQIYICVL